MFDLLVFRKPHKVMRNDVFVGDEITNTYISYVT